MNNEIKTKKEKIVNKKTLLVTVDIGKVTNMGYYRCPDGTEIKPFEFFNTAGGFHGFWMCISKACRIHNLQEIIVGFESTGPYAQPLMHYMRKREVKLVQVNPMHTKRLKELQGNSPNKTDKKDPKVIADIIELGHALKRVVPEGAAAELRRLIQARERRLDMRTQLLNQLHDLIAVVFPEFLEVMKGTKTVTAQSPLKNYPTPQNISELGLEELTSILRKTSRGKLGHQRARELYEAARACIGIQEGRTSIVFEINNILAVIEASNHFVEKIEKKFLIISRKFPTVNLFFL